MDMMLIIADKLPYKAVDYLIEHTNKNFVFKQLLELGQLVSSCGISEVYKKINQGKKIQKWCFRNVCWTYEYFDYLYHFCCLNINMKKETQEKLFQINRDLRFEGEKITPYHDFKVGKHTWNFLIPQTAIFRYKQGYESKYETNSELPINIAIEEYKKYLDWKFKKDEVTDVCKNR